MAITVAMRCGSARFDARRHGLGGAASRLPWLAGGAISTIATPQAPPGAFDGPRAGGPSPKNSPSEIDLFQVSEIKRKQVEPHA
jgi:hypothetical protein